MTQIINELATIKVSHEALQNIDLKEIFQSFANNYKKLDNLKNFRSDYEKKNWAMRWWHNDKLRDAQLDSSEVQAEFSKTIGQLMLLSIMLSKQLAEQQTQLNEQQTELKTQANGIVEHSNELQQQHQLLAEQSKRLETLVHEYFELKGLTEEGAQKLIDIANEAKATKQSMLEEFSMRANEVEDLCNTVSGQMGFLSAEVAEQIKLSAEQTLAAINTQQQQTRELLAASESAQLEERQALQQALSRSMTSLEHRQSEAQAYLQSKQSALESSLSELRINHEQQKDLNDQRLNAIDREITGLSETSVDLASVLSRTNASLATCIEQQETNRNLFENSHREVLRKLKRMGYIATGLSTAVAGLLAWVAYLSSYM